MNNCAVVCEYNPFHSGHKYQIDRARERGAYGVYCIMSGNFTQSALPVFCDKSIRAECAVLGGADAVIELPVIYCTASAATFAEGGVKIAAGIRDIKYLAMGAMGGSDEILRIADVKIKYRDEIESRVKQYLRNGKSYNFGTVAAISEIYSRLHGDEKRAAEILSDPNNILCIEYIAAIDKLAANIEPMIIQRVGAAYNDLSVDAPHTSATAIRHAFDSCEYEKVAKYIPYNADKIIEFRKNHSPNLSAYKNIAAFAVKSRSASELISLRNCADGLDRVIEKMSVTSYDEIINSKQCKKYGKKRLQRLFLDAALGIDNTTQNNRFCTRLLACANSFDFATLPNCVKTNNAEIKRAASEDSEIKNALAIDERAAVLYNLICGTHGDYYNYSLVKCDNGTRK